MGKNFHIGPFIVVFLFFSFCFLNQAEAIPYIYTFQANLKPELIWKVKIDREADGYILKSSGEKLVPTDQEYDELNSQAGFDYFYTELLEGPQTDSVSHPISSSLGSGIGLDAGDSLFCAYDYAEGGGGFINNYLYMGTYEHPLLIMFMKDFNSIQVGDSADPTLTAWDGFYGDQLDIQLKDISDPTVPVPEPKPIVLMTVGIMIGIAFFSKKKVFRERAAIYG